MSKLLCVRCSNGALRYYRKGKCVRTDTLTDKQKKVPIRSPRKKRSTTFNITLPIDVLVWILAQHPRLLAMTCYLSKDISAKARSLRTKYLIYKPFLPREFGCPTRFPTPVGMYMANGTKWCRSPYAWVRLLGKAWYVVLPRKDQNKYFAGTEFPWYPEIMTERQPDLYTSRELYRRRGVEDPQRMVREILCEKYQKHETLLELLTLHAFLLMHRVLLRGEGICHSYSIEGELNGPWKQDIVNNLVEEIKEMYVEVMISL